MNQTINLPTGMDRVVGMFHSLHGISLTSQQAWHLVTLIEMAASVDTSEHPLEQVDDNVAVQEPVVEVKVTQPEPVVESEPEPVVKPEPEHRTSSLSNMDKIPEEAWANPGRYNNGSADKERGKSVSSTSPLYSNKDTGADVMILPERWWLPTHLWKIHVEPRDIDDKTLSAYYVHCREKPSAELFNEHYQLFLKRTHRVYVLKSDGKQSEDVTREYLYSGRPTQKETVSVKSSEWEDETANFRVRFYDTRAGGTNYVYFRNQPSGFVLARYHSTKQFAVVETRPVN